MSSLVVGMSPAIWDFTLAIEKKLFLFSTSTSGSSADYK
jgi:hypothetical protein